jgi:pyridoxine 5-phosphate synthase
MIRLGVNIDHAATLRQVRGGTTAYPSLLKLTKMIAEAGGHQITIHLREDRRHIQLADLADLSKNCPLPLNLEMAATDTMVKIAKRYKPSWCCFVPEKRQELTTEGGLNVVKAKKKIAKYVERLQVIGIETSMFIDPSLEQVKASFEVGADAVEFHTGKWVLQKGRARDREWKRLVEAAVAADKLGLMVHAGHGLDFSSAEKIKALPHLREVNIGHSLICYSLETGIAEAIREMQKRLL